MIIRDKSNKIVDYDPIKRFEKKLKKFERKKEEEKNKI